jgi:hypothetical protein
MSYQQFSPQTIKHTSIMAMVSLAASISSFFFVPVLGSVIGIVAGNMAKKEIRESNGMIVGESLAQLGVVIGWVGIALWGLGICCGLLAAVLGLLPVIGGICVSILPFLGELLPWLLPAPTPSPSSLLIVPMLLVMG